MWKLTNTCSSAPPQGYLRCGPIWEIPLFSSLLLFLCRATLHWNIVFGSMRLWTTRQHISKRRKADAEINKQLFLYRATLHWNTVFGAMRLSETPYGASNETRCWKRHETTSCTYMAKHVNETTSCTYIARWEVLLNSLFNAAEGLHRHTRGTLVAHTWHTHGTHVAHTWHTVKTRHNGSVRNQSAF
jgi:hypothetical protein